MTNFVKTNDRVSLKPGVSVAGYPDCSTWKGTVVLTNMEPEPFRITCRVLFDNGVMLTYINAENLIVLDNDQATPDTD